jgi:hypothetical protein
MVTAPGGHVVEARDQVEDRALAAARGADQGDRLAPAGGQADLGQGRGVVAIGEADLVEGDRRLARRQGLGVCGIDDGRLDVQRLEQAPGAGEAFAEHRLQVGDLPQGLQGCPEGEQEAGERPGGHAARAGPPAGVDEDARGDQGAEGLGGRRGHGLGVGALDQVALAAFDHGGHAAFLVGLAVLHLDDLDAVQAFHDRGRQVGGLAHGALGGLGGLFREPPDEQAGDGRDDQHAGRQDPVQLEHDHQHADHGQDFAGVVDHAAGRRLADQGGVVEHRRDVRARMGAAQPGQVRAHQLAEQSHLHVADHAVADLVDRPRLQHLEQAARNGDHGDQQRDPPQGAGLGMGDQLVDRRFQHLGQARAQGGDDRGADDRDRQGPSARLEVVAPDPRGEGAVAGLRRGGIGHGAGVGFRGGTVKLGHGRQCGGGAALWLLHYRAVAPT